MIQMKTLINVLFSIFFIIAIGVHIYNVAIQPDGNPFWWHGIYFITYGICWWMVFSRINYRSLLYASMAIFPFITHFYYGYKHLVLLDSTFWICFIVCILLPLGFFWVKNTTQHNSTIFS